MTSWPCEDLIHTMIVQMRTCDNRTVGEDREQTNGSSNATESQVSPRGFKVSGRGFPSFYSMGFLDTLWFLGAGMHLIIIGFFF